MFTTYLGRESAAVRRLAGQSIPDSQRERRCDAYGRQLGLACLPGRSHADCHDGIRDRVIGDVLQSGVRGEMEAAHLFASVVPVRAQGENSGLRPDARLAGVDMPRDIYRLPPVPPGMRRTAEELVAARRRRGAQPPPGSTRGLDLLWDIKTIHGGSDSCTCALARDAQGGAVTQRARQVDAEYARIALRLDRGVAGTVTARLREWPAVRALVFGQYGEGSADVHDLLGAVGGGGWTGRWARMGARSAAEATSYFTTQMRRSWGVAAVREMARHRLRRTCFVGVTRARARVLAGREDAPAEARGDAPAWPLGDAAAFHVHQGHHHAPP